jgi:iron complex outermembrane receptor protein
VILALTAAAPAVAQTSADSSPNGTGASSSKTLEQGAAPQEGDITVTARRREESIRDVPGTISAITADQLNAKGPIVSTGDLLSMVPGIRFNDLASENLAEVAIRGSGTERATGADSGVGLFVNGAYVGSSTLGGRNFKTLDYFDLERVEVLEGPQGALYGRNSEFGVVNIVLAKPKFENSGYLRDMITAGLDQNRFAAVINRGLSDKIAVRIGGELYHQAGGFYYDPIHNKHYDNTDGWVLRGQIRYRSGPLDVTLSADGQDLRLPTFVNSYVVPGGGVNAQLPQGFLQSRFVLPHDGRDGLQQKQQRLMLSAHYDFGWATLESTTMATKWRSSQQFASLIDIATEIAFQRSGQLGAYPFDQTTTDVRDRTFYQDLHLSGKAADGRLSWTIGGEALVQHDDYVRTVTSSPCAFRLGAGICGGTPTAPVCVLPLATSTPCPTPFPSRFGIDSRTRQDIQSFAGYASLQYTLGNLTVAGEGRFSHDDKSASQAIYALYTSNLTTTPNSFAFHSNKASYTATISYKTTDPSHTLIYAKVGTGYRAGGVNNGTFNPLAPNPFLSSYGNEDTISYEVGVKSRLTHNVNVRASAYLSRTDDAITVINDGCTVTNVCGTGQQIFNVNGGRVHARGVEVVLDGRFALVGGLLSASTNATYGHATFAKVPTGVAGLPVQGSSVPQIPDWAWSANLDYRHPITPSVAAFVNLSYSAQRGGIQDAVTIATPAIQMSEFDIFGARAGVDIGKLQLAMFVRNFTDQEIQVLKFQQAGFPLSVRYNKPRTFGGSISYRW